MEFDSRYKQLNQAQKLAVDCIDGPVMVIAGPGTGKTELLSLRVANILKKTDTLPENILCLTFTDSATSEMRERLVGIIGKEAYKVAIHTFHSFGSEVINQNSQFFYEGAYFRPADELSSYEVLRLIFDELPHDNPLSIKVNDEFIYLRDSQKTISEIKKSGLTSDELIAILDEDIFVIDKAEKLLAPIFAGKISKETGSKLSKIIKIIEKISDTEIQSDIVGLSKVMADSLSQAVDESTSTNSTKPLTAWRNSWLKKNDGNDWVLKSRERITKLRALCFIYEQYLSRMQQAELYDFDDMILRVVHAMEIFSELKFNLQEKYQYVLVDEFQDTNLAQMRILHNLVNSEASNDMPNLMVVGDDDQAIYSFQGADISNIVNFRHDYPKTQIITLNENYRSVSDILEKSRIVISQGKDRLENSIEGITKQLNSNREADGGAHLHAAQTISDERQWLIADIEKQIKQGISPSDIAVLTRKHSEIEQLLPYFSHSKIPVSYERQDNVLDLAPIILIEKVARLLINLSEGKHDEVNSLMPEILSHQTWGIEPVKLCQLSVKAYNQRGRWLEIMGSEPDLKPIHDWIVNTASAINETPLEQMLDIIIGNPDSPYADKKSAYPSPIYEYFFSRKVDDGLSQYLTYLEGLRTIRSKLREYHPELSLTLKNFVSFIELNRQIGSVIKLTRQIPASKVSVNIMTAHKSKGSEFQVVYVVNAVDSVWGEKARKRNHMISYPENLPFAVAGETEDERLRLFYVAITRAKNTLNVSYGIQNDNGKATLPASFLADIEWGSTEISHRDSVSSAITSAELAWYQSVANLAESNLSDLLGDRLKNYQINATHLNYFMDITRGGPSTFLVHNLLHFPTAKSSDASFGSAVHDTLRQAHQHFSTSGTKQAVEDIVANFEKYLTHERLSKQDFQKYLRKGSDCLQKFLEQKYDDFNTKQRVEVNFALQGSVVDSASLTGKLDVLEIDKPNRKLLITDYKTGKPVNNWSGKTESEKTKLYKYRQQLLFYKLLVENSRDYHSYDVSDAILQFVEPSTSGEIQSLHIEFDKAELDKLSRLINSVWQHIVNLDFPDTSGYQPNYKGILAFEKDLLDGTI